MSVVVQFSSRYLMQFIEFRSPFFMRYKKQWNESHSMDPAGWDRDKLVTFVQKL